MKHSHLWSVFIMALLLPLFGCSDSEEMNESVEKGAFLSLRLTLSESNGQTRSEGAYSFEDPSTQYESLNSLRVIITSKGRIEINDYVSGMEGVRFIERNYKVTPDDVKTVYLIGNEESFKAVLEGNEIVFSDFQSGEALPEDFPEILIYADEDAVVVNNEEENKKYLPMSEIFRVKVDPLPENGNGTSTTIANLFLTRAATKFSFLINEESDITDDIKIDKIKITSLADREYFFPKSTVYSPEKYENTRYGRFISAFEAPEADMVVREFYPPALSRIKNNVSGEFVTSAYSPAIYFAETALDKFYVSLDCTVTNEEETRKFTYTSLLDNLPTLPRNTFVYINIKFRKGPDNIVVDVIPYLGVDLNPDFGFDEPLPRPPQTEGERPPWIIVDENGEFYQD